MVGLEDFVRKGLFPNRRVLLVAHEYLKGGGIATYVRNAKLALEAEGLSVDVLVRPFSQPDETELFVENGAVTLHGDVSSTLEARGYDVVHLNSLSTARQFNFFPRSDLGLAAFPIVYTAHSSISDEVGCFQRQGFPVALKNYEKSLRAQEELIAIADRVIVPGTTLRNTIDAQTSVTKTEVVPNPVYLPAFDPDRVDAIAQWIRRKYAPNNEELLVYPGRVSQEKGVYELAQAYNILRKTRRNLRVLYVGSGSGTSLVSQILGADNNGNISDGNGNKYNPFIGWKQGEDLLAYYTAADAVIIPSLMESFGLSAAEALLMKKPLIVSDVDGLHEYFVQPRFAYGISDPGNIHAIANTVNVCLSEKGTKEQSKMIAQGSSTLRAEFDLRKFAQRTIGVYADAIEVSQHRRRYYSRIPSDLDGLEGLLREEPDNGAVLYHLAKAVRERGRQDLAERILQEATKAVFKPLYGVEKQDVYVALAELYYQKRDYTMLRALLIEGMSLPEHQKIERYRKEVTDGWYTAGSKARSTRQPELARSYFTLVTAVDPGHGNAHHRLAQTYREGGRLELAREHYEVALALRAKMFPEEFLTGFSSEVYSAGRFQTYHFGSAKSEVDLYRFRAPRIVYTAPETRRALAGFAVKKVVLEGPERDLAIQRTRTEHSVLEKLATDPRFQHEFKTPLPLAYDREGTIIMELVQGKPVTERIKQEPKLFIEYMERIAAFASLLHSIDERPASSKILGTVPYYSVLVEKNRMDASRYGADPRYQRIRDYLKQGSTVPIGDRFSFVHGDQSIAVYYDTGRELYCIDFNNSGYGLPSGDAAFIISNAYTHLSEIVPISVFKEGIERFTEVYTKDMSAKQRSDFSQQLPYFLAGAEYWKVGHLGLSAIDHNIRRVYQIPA